MQTITLGRSKLEVSRIAFGTWQLGGEWGSVDADEAKAAIRHAIDLGVSFFDTAQAYGFGASERMLGEALRHELDTNRDSVIIATKGGINPGKEPARDSSRQWLREGVHSSLAALAWITSTSIRCTGPTSGQPLRTPLDISRRWWLKG
jgi:aryl-alcohol dehydrogenase-like predicted oxidoreductase